MTKTFTRAINEDYREALEKKQSHWQLELLESAKNLEGNMISKKEKKLNKNTNKKAEL